LWRPAAYAILHRIIAGDKYKYNTNTAVQGILTTSIVASRLIQVFVVVSLTKNE